MNSKLNFDILVKNSDKLACEIEIFGGLDYSSPGICELREIEAIAADIVDMARKELNRLELKV